MIGDEPQQPLTFVAEMGGQLRAHSIADQPPTVTDTQALASGTEGKAQKIHRRWFAQHVAQSIAEMDRGAGRRFDRVIDQSGAAELQESAMTDFHLCCPTQQLAPLSARQKAAELLARAIP